MRAARPTADLVPAIGYVRVSMAREEMISPELQEAAIKGWAKQNRRKIVKWVIDLDATGRNFKRKIMKAISLVEDGAAKEIIVWKYSRFGRNRHGNAINLERVERAGGQLESATEQVDARTAAGRFQRGMLFEVAAFESDRAGEQWKETHDHRREQGLPSAGRPRYGYVWYPRKVYEPDGHISLQDERYEPDPSAREYVVDLYRRYASGTGFPVLAAWLNGTGQRTTRGTLWGARTVQRYMDSGFAAGYLRVHDPECTIRPYSTACRNHQLVRGRHDALITADEWSAYLKQRAAVKDLAPRVRAATYPTTGLVRCGLCKGTAIRSGSKQSILCASRRRKGPTACQGTSRLASLVEKSLLEWLSDLAVEIDVTAAGLQASRGAVQRGDSTARREELAGRIARLERAITKHMRVYALSEEDDPDGVLEKEYLETLNGMRAEKAELSKEHQDLERKADGESARERLMAEAMAAAVGLVREWDIIPPARANRLLRRLISAVYILPGGDVDIVPTWAEDRETSRG